MEGVPPALRADVEGETPLRPDAVHSCEALGEMLAQAADREGAFVRVPKIATGSDDPTN